MQFKLTNLVRSLEAAEDDNVGSKEYLASLIAPPAINRSAESSRSWEFVDLCQLEESSRVSVRSSTTNRKSHSNVYKSDGTPVKSLKYMIHTPPRPVLVPGSLPSSTGSTPNFSVLSSSGDVSPDLYAELNHWPELEDLLVTVPEWANCSICSELFDEPVEWPGCEHIFCKSCVTRILNFGHRDCPLCRGTLPNDCGFDDLALSSRMASAISLLPSRCRWGLLAVRKRKVSNALDLGSTPSSSSQTNSLLGFHSASYGTPSSSMSSIDLYMKSAAPEIAWIPAATPKSCPEIVPLQSLPEHHLNCPYTPVRCLYPDCRQIFPRFEIETHQETCVHKPTACNLCSATNLSKLTLPGHLAVCPESKITCECGETFLRKAHAEHVRDTCVFADLPCKFAKHGCPYVGPRNALDNHLATCPYEALKGYIAHTEERFQEYDKTIERLESMILSLRTQIHHNNPRNIARNASGHANASSSQPTSWNQSRNSHSTSPFSLSTSTGPVGHGNRKNRFWYDDSLDQDSDEDSMMFF